ncbi:MAG: Flagellar protein FliS, partial [Pseudonocardiales bacterium]|nr:Flagellar protein FliS [Pseudonocardiales bacterium]
MAADDARARYLRDRVLTATPAQRVVMLYDRLALDLGLASTVAASAVGISAVGTSAVDTDRHAVAAHLSHALEVVAELHASLDLTA